MELIATKEACRMLGVSRQTFSTLKQMAQWSTFGWGREDKFDRADIEKLKTLSKSERKDFLTRNKK